MKNPKLPWYIFIILCITKIIFLILSILLATKTIYIYPFSNVNNTTSFLLRNILTTILQTSAYILFTKKKYFKNKELTTVLCLFTFPVFLDVLGNIYTNQGKRKKIRITLCNSNYYINNLLGIV